MTVPSKHPIAIELNKVTKTYHTGGGALRTISRKVVALNEVDFSISKGEVFGLVGESGSGKTTIGRLIVRLEKPDTGTIKVGQEPIARLRGGALKNFRRSVQMIFQDPYQSLNPYLPVNDTVAEPLKIHNRYTSDHIRDRVRQTLEMVGLTPVTEIIGRYPHQLSGGQRQRVAIARAMVLAPEIVVADEPTSMLDASISVQIFQILTDIQHRKHMTLLYITHSLAAAHFLCDRIAVIYRGFIVEIGPAKEIISTPCHPYTQALLDALPKFGRPRHEKQFNTLRRHARSDEPPEGCPFYNRCNRAQVGLCQNTRPDLFDLGDNHHSACFFAAKLKDEAKT